MTAVRILVVEDEGVAAELIQGVLHNLGHEVCGIAAYGEEAWKIQLDGLCARTNESMSMSVDELKSLVAGCDKLKPVIEGLEESPRKLYRKRLQMCRNLLSYLLETKLRGEQK